MCNTEAEILMLTDHCEKQVTCSQSVLDHEHSTTHSKLRYRCVQSCIMFKCATLALKLLPVLALCVCTSLAFLFGMHKLHEQAKVKARQTLVPLNTCKL